MEARSEQEVPKQRRSLLRWKGLLADANRTVRIMVLIMLAVVCLAQTFMQFGFVGIGLGGGRSAYAILLLLPISMTALLFGAIYAAVLGLFAGAVLYAHAWLLPLDFYELAYVNWATSVVLLALTGLLLGVLFAFVLRNNPKPPRRFVYITIVCVIISGLVSTCFFINTFFTMVFDLAKGAALAGGSDKTLSQMSQQYVVVLATRMGSVDMQILIDAVLMAVLCIVSDIAARKINIVAGDVGLRALFYSWLLAVVFIAFLATSAMSFVATSIGEIRNAEIDAREEATYVCDQLDESAKREQAVNRLLESVGVSKDDLAKKSVSDVYEATTASNLLKGYVEEADGLVIVSDAEDKIVSADNELLKPGDKLADHFSLDFINALSSSLASDNIQRIIYDGVVKDMNAFVSEAYEADALEYLDSGGGSAKQGIYEHTELAYMYTQESSKGLRVTLVRPSTLVFADRDGVMLWSSLSVLILLLVVFALTSLLITRFILRHIDDTNGVLARITQGNLDERVKPNSTREFTALADGINTTVGAMQGWIEEAKTRLDTELATARTIQESALPRIFPPFPDITSFDIYASMTPAKEVGGDFYDFFIIGDGHDAHSGKLGFVIADVSGKGIPAALFMMSAKAQIRDYMESGMELGEAFENTNRQLCDGNTAGMFVTVFAGVLDYATGHVDFVNAGHNPPLLWQGDSWRWLNEKSGLPLGLFEGLPYEAFSVDCQVGDQFLLYTDGVTEAMSVKEELYGEQRLEALANENFSLHPRMLTEAVRADVARHAQGAEQSDDITILALEVGVPPEITATLRVPADDKELPRVNEFIHTELDRRLCPQRAQLQLDIAVEELFVNVCHYAYPDATPENPGYVRVSYTYTADPPTVQVDIIDKGVPYDPLAKPDAVTPEDIMEVPIGGLGILMAKQSVDEMRYERLDDNNIVSIVKKW